MKSTTFGRIAYSHRIAINLLNQLGSRVSIGIVVPEEAVVDMLVLDSRWIVIDEFHLVLMIMLAESKSVCVILLVALPVLVLIMERRSLV